MLGDHQAYIECWASDRKHQTGVMVVYEESAVGDGEIAVPETRIGRSTSLDGEDDYSCLAPIPIILET